MLMHNSHAHQFLLALVVATAVLLGGCALSDRLKEDGGRDHETEILHNWLLTYSSIWSAVEIAFEFIS